MIYLCSIKEIQYDDHYFYCDGKIVCVEQKLLRKKIFFFDNKGEYQDYDGAMPSIFIENIFYIPVCYGEEKYAILQTIVELKIIEKLC